AGPFEADPFSQGLEIGEVHAAAGGKTSLARSSSEARQRPSDMRFQLRAMPWARSHRRLGSVYAAKRRRLPRHSPEKMGEPQGKRAVSTKPWRAANSSTSASGTWFAWLHSFAAWR